MLVASADEVEECLSGELVGGPPGRWVPVGRLVAGFGLDRLFVESFGFGADGGGEELGGEGVEVEAAVDGAVVVGFVAEPGGLVPEVFLWQQAVGVGGVDPVGEGPFEVGPVEGGGDVDQQFLGFDELLVGEVAVGSAEFLEVFGRQDTGTVGVGEDGEAFEPPVQQHGAS